MIKSPSEAYEAEILVRYLEKNGMLFTHIPLGQYIRSPAARMRAKRQGVRKGFPDYAIVKGTKLVFIELKKRSGGRVAPEQKIWLETLTDCGLHANVCRGARAAIAWLESL